MCFDEKMSNMRNFYICFGNILTGNSRIFLLYVTNVILGTPWIGIFSHLMLQDSDRIQIFMFILQDWKRYIRWFTCNKNNVKITRIGQNSVQSIINNTSDFEAFFFNVKIRYTLERFGMLKIIFFSNIVKK
jgi:hypothetical protein